MLTIIFDEDQQNFKNRGEADKRIKTLEPGEWGWAIESTPKVKRVFWLFNGKDVLWMDRPPYLAEIKESKHLTGA